MAAKVTINLDQTAADYLAGYGAGALIFLQSSSSEGGSYSAVSSTAIVSGTEQYEVWDSAGASTTWYRFRIGDSGGSSFTDFSDASRADPEAVRDAFTLGHDAPADAPLLLDRYDGTRWRHAAS